MVRTQNYPVLPTKEQGLTLDSWRISCRQLYNGALEERRNAWKKQHRSVSYEDQTISLTELRKSSPEWAAIPAEILRSALHRIQTSFQGFFRRHKRGEKPGYPRYKSREHYNSFSFAGNLTEVQGNKVWVPKLGWVKLNLYRPIPPGAKILVVRFKLTAKGWKVGLVLDLGEAPKKLPIKTEIGIDVGLTHFATLSNGEHVKNPRYYRESEERLARQQKELSAKKRGSNSRRIAKRQIAKTHLKIHNQRLDYARKQAKELVKNYDLVCFEDLNIKGMVQSKLAKSINDAAWGMLLNCIMFKAEEAGRYAIGVNPRGTSIRCSRCQEEVKKTLADREHNCPHCGLRIDRDVNAALNILALGRSVVSKGAFYEAPRTPKA